ncbi:MAG: hypothetical protein JWO82_2837, partial [Akkermansiaceae bacterium]|nr:hypothetical protein [Akkermansiaceae bacterium]
FPAALLAWLLAASWALGFQGIAPLATLAALRDAVSDSGRAVRGFRLEGVVCAVNRPAGLVALRDASGVELLEMASVPETLATGSSVVIESDPCSVTRGPLALQLGTGPVVEIDGQHPPAMRSGQVYLNAGMQPLRVEWFNGVSSLQLEVDFTRPGVERRALEAADLWRPDGKGGFAPGVDFAAYEGLDWVALPDFSRLQPVATGTVPELDLGVRSREEFCGLVFNGYLKVPRPGIYDFRLTCDDGARLFVGQPEIHWTVQPADSAHPVTAAPFAKASSGQWAVAEGMVSFATDESGLLKFELSDSSATIPVTLADPGPHRAATILRKRVRVTGLSRAGGLVAIDPAQLEILAGKPEQDETLTQAVEIRRLKPEQAAKPYRVMLEGVVTMANTQALVLQDSSGGVYVHYISATSSNAPKPGERWRIEGTTAPGDFSPVVIAAEATYLSVDQLPKPVRPTWEQLLSGTLDAEQVEIEGVVVSATDSEVRLLTRDGVVSISHHPLYPLPVLALSPAERDALTGSVVRFRGVYASSWDKAISRVHPAELKLGNATLTVDEPAPADPFAAAPIRAADLLRFTSQSSALQRVKVSGTVLHAQPPEFLLSDGAQGFRVVSAQDSALQPGDQVEAVGFPRLGGPSPVLLEGQLRKTGAAALPEAAGISPAALPDSKLDSTRVTIEATVLSDSLRQDERVLELHTGSNHFFAFIPAWIALPDKFERDTVLRLTGTYVSASTDRALASPDPFELRLDRAADLVVLQRGPWWTIRHTVIVISILSGSLILSALWVTVLRRTVAKRSNELAREIEERESVERHRIMEQERSRVAQDLHDELGSGLTEAGILTALLKNPAIEQDKKSGYLTQLSAVCFSLVTGLDEIVWAVNPRYDSVADLAGYFSMFAQRFLGLAGIRCRLKIDDAIPELPLDSRRRHGIFLALKEALNNVVRHSRAEEAHLTIEVVEEQLRIALADDGCGFDSSPAAPGSDGLRGMRERIAQLGGVCLVESAAGQGTTIRFHLSLERNYP